MKIIWGIRITCNYIKLNKQSIIPVLALPKVDDLLPNLKEGKVFTTVDLLSDFFQGQIDADPILLNAVCT